MHFECVLEHISELETEEQVQTYLHLIPTPGGEYLDFTYETITLTLETPAFNTTYSSKKNLIPNLCAVLFYLEGLNNELNSKSVPILIKFDENIQDPLLTAIKEGAVVPASSSSSLYSTEKNAELTYLNSRSQDRAALLPTVTPAHPAGKRSYPEREDSNVSVLNLSIFSPVPKAKIPRSTKDAREKHGIVEKNYRKRLKDNRILAANTLENADTILKQETSKIDVSLEGLSNFISLLPPAAQNSAEVFLEQIKCSNAKISATATPFLEIAKKMEIKNRTENLTSMEDEEHETANASPGGPN